MKHFKEYYGDTVAFCGSDEMSMTNFRNHVNCPECKKLMMEKGLVSFEPSQAVRDMFKLGR